MLFVIRCDIERLLVVYERGYSHVSVCIRAGKGFNVIPEIFLFEYRVYRSQAEGSASKIRGKDIADGILGLINKTGAKTIDGLFNALQRERNHLLDKLTKKGVRRPSQHPKMELLEQKVDVIECLADEVNTVSELKEMISSIFSDDVKGIMLSTIHKAKGLENDRVFFLLPELIPSKYATQDWQYEQERNLKYVGITRAKRELIYVWDADFKSDLENRVIITNSKTRRI